MLHWPGIEPGPPAWQARILPLNHQCSLDTWGLICGSASCLSAAGRLFSLFPQQEKFMDWIRVGF